MKKLVSSGLPADSSPSDFDALLYPARAFARPSDVVSDPDLSLNEKRAILALWACVWYYETSEKTLVVSSPTAAVANGQLPAGPTA